MRAEKMNEAVEAEARRLAKEREEMEAGKKKAKEEARRLKLELEELQAGFAVQKEELKVEY